MLKDHNCKPYMYPEYPRFFGKDSWDIYGYSRDGHYIDDYEKWQKYANESVKVNFIEKPYNKSYD